MQSPAPGMPFNHSMGLPLELTLTTTTDGPRLTIRPAVELERIRTSIVTHGRRVLTSLPVELTRWQGDALDLQVELSAGSAESVMIGIGEDELVWRPRARELCFGEHRAAIIGSGELSLRLLIDRGSIEIFGDHDRLYFPIAARIEIDAGITLRTGGGEAVCRDAEIALLSSVW